VPALERCVEDIPASTKYLVLGTASSSLDLAPEGAALALNVEERIVGREAHQLLAARRAWSVVDDVLLFRVSGRLHAADAIQGRSKSQRGERGPSTGQRSA
jgi:hypothetical protein